jgi:phosphoglycerol transferase MdoB-like AlkP superfamily enzyme
MNLQNSRLDPSDQRTCSGRKWKCWHRWIPAWILAAYLGCFGLWPIFQDFRAVVFLPFGLLLGHSYWFSALGLPGSVQMLLVIVLAILLFALPWLSALSSSPRASTICTLGVIAVLLMQLSGCWLQRQAAKTNTTLAREFISRMS